MSPRLARGAFALALLSICAALRANVDQKFQLDTNDWKIQPKTVNLAGDFNGWSTDATPMKPSGHVWSATVSLEEGPHAYKFVIDHGTKDQRWIADPKADKSLESSDGNGGMNSGVIAGTDVKSLPPAKPDDINDKAVRFDPKDSADLSAVDDRYVRVRVRVLADDVQRVLVAPDNHGTWTRLERISTEHGLDVYGGVADISGIEGAANPTAGKRGFIILLADGSDSLEINATGLKRSSEAHHEMIVPPPAPSQVPAWTADANWYQIFTERFRNGDTSNDPGDMPGERLIKWNAEWFKTQPGEAPGDENFFHGEGNVWKRRYGGDLKGVQEKLPYLRSLGINAIYFNPIFEAESMHKYDTADYRHVDDNFGVRDSEAQRGTSAPLVTEPQAPQDHERGAHATKPLGNRELFNRDGSPVSKDYRESEDPKSWRWTKSDLLFLDFLKDAHAQGFHVIVDGVFNHVGRAHVYFQDVLKNGKHSKYADWFEITDWGDPKNWKQLDDPFTVHGKPGGIQWNAWDGKNGALPNWKKDPKLGIAHGPREHILAIAQRWGDPDGDPKTNDGIDGWRLDAAEQVPHPFWVDFRTTVKKTNPDAYIDGEIWNPAQPWINDGKQFDAVMNYQFAMAAQAFFVNVEKQAKPSELNARLAKIWFMYPQPNALAMQNLFDSHDTDRLASMIVNPDRPYDGENRPQDNAAGKKYDMRAPNAEEWKRLLQAVAFQNTFIGAPMTYYGDEAGMWGADDPSDRQPFPWDDKGPYPDGVGFNKEIFAGFQRFIAIRNKLPALRTGTFYPLVIDDAQNTYAFARELGDQHVYVAINRSNEPRTVKLDGAAEGSYVDYADTKQAKVEMDETDATTRPSIAAESTATPLTPTGGSLSISLPPYGVAILAPR